MKRKRAEGERKRVRQTSQCGIKRQKQGEVVESGRRGRRRKQTARDISSMLRECLPKFCLKLFIIFVSVNRSLGCHFTTPTRFICQLHNNKKIKQNITSSSSNKNKIRKIANMKIHKIHDTKFNHIR